MCTTVRQFRRACLRQRPGDAEPRSYARAWRDYDTQGAGRAEGCAALERAVHAQLMSDVPYGVLLSGGLDSSLVAACAARLRASARRGGRPVRSLVAAAALFAIGLEVRRTWRRPDRREGAGHRAPRLHLHASRRASTRCPT